MSVTLRSLRLAEAERDVAAMAACQLMTPISLGQLFRAVMKAYQIRSKVRRRKGGRA